MSDLGGWYQFERGRIEWLHRRHAKGEFISADDVAAVVEMTPDAIGDELLRSYILPGLKGDLRPPRGRKARAIFQRIFLECAGAWIEERRLEIRDATDGNRKRGDLEPSIQAANEIASEYRGIIGSMSGRSLLNAISQLKNQPV